MAENPFWDKTFHIAWLLKTHKLFAIVYTTALFCTGESGEISKLQQASSKIVQLFQKTLQDVKISNNIPAHYYHHALAQFDAGTQEALVIAKG